MSKKMGRDRARPLQTIKVSWSAGGTRQAWIDNISLAYETVLQKQWSGDSRQYDARTRSIGVAQKAARDFVERRTKKFARKTARPAGRQDLAGNLRGQSSGGGRS